MQVVPAWQISMLENVFHIFVSNNESTASIEALTTVIKELAEADFEKATKDRQGYSKLFQLTLPGNNKALERFRARLNTMLADNNKAKQPISSETPQIGSCCDQSTCHVFRVQITENVHEKAVQSVLEDSLISVGIPSSVVVGKSGGNTQCRVCVTTSANFTRVYDAIERVSWVESVSPDLGI